MNRVEVYMKLKSDLAGSKSKKRFRLELLRGIDKMLELMETFENFTMVFDYVCKVLFSEYANRV